MKKLLVIPAYIWAVACLLLIPITFAGNDSFAQQLAKLPFMKVSPIYSGGTVVKTINEKGLETHIYKPVFESLFGESNEGFIQVRFSSPDTLPEIITTNIDYNLDGTDDFDLSVNTRNGETHITTKNPLVTKVSVSSKVKNNWIVRIGLKNPIK